MNKNKDLIAEIICVGTELLLGDILNTNARYLSKRLAELGVSVFYQTVIGDNENRLMEMINLSKGRSDIIILSGGLGPTTDDITKETVAKALNLPLIMDENQSKKIEEYFLNRDLKMSDSNLKQALIPEGGTALNNNNGTAPGILIETENKTYIILPGPPNELIPMFEEYIIPYIKGISKDIIISKTLKLIGIGESSAAELIQDIIENSKNPTVAPYAKTSEVHIRITAKAENVQIANRLIEDCEIEVRKHLEEYIYTSLDKELEEIILEELSTYNKTISTAESCTGGLIASSLINYSGASKVFLEGKITYSNESKIKELDVNPKTIEAYGAVSEETAKEMAIGIKKFSNTDIGLSITGIAGPTGETKEKPIGLVYICIAYKDNTFIKKVILSGNRSKIRNTAAKQALIYLYQIIKDCIID